MASVFRFAPSPNGFLHLGHAFSALLNHDMATAAGGRLLLRIEDIDRSRCRPEFEAAIYEDLAWLGIKWETTVRRQSAHLAEYRAALERLKAKALIYAGFESRAEIARLVAAREPWPCGPAGAPLYPGTGRTLSPEQRARRAGEDHALRLDVKTALARLQVPLAWSETGGGASRETAANPAAGGDVILGRKDTPTSYHLSVVLDDAWQGVTQVVRGRDLYEATSVHRLLQELMGLPAPLYHHHRLVLDRDGNKLATRDPSTTLRDLRAQGWTAGAVRAAVGL